MKLSGTKTFSNEAAERYALALFEISNESSELDVVELKVSQLLKIYHENSEFRNFNNLSLDSSGKSSSIEQKIKFPPKVRN